MINRRSLLGGLSVGVSALTGSGAWGQVSDFDPIAEPLPRGAILASRDRIESVPSFVRQEFIGTSANLVRWARAEAQFGPVCTSFAATNAFAILSAVRSGRDQIGDRDLLDPYHLDRCVRLDQDKCNSTSGIDIPTALEKFQKIGLPSRGDGSNACRVGCQTDPSYLKLKDFGLCMSHWGAPELKDSDYSDTLKVVGAGFPVIAAINATIGFQSKFLLGRNHLFDLTSESSDQFGSDADNIHAVVICGFDADGAYVMNSWGALWGYRGFGRVSHDSMKLILLEAYAIDI